ncbi:MAG: DotI/IcmL/TraM family protein [Gammaproteobacteria bacterium]
MSADRSENLEKKNDFYRDRYQSVIVALIIEMIILLILVALVLYQIFHRPLPQFIAATPTNQQMVLTSSVEPNLLSSTLIRWASKAAVAAYTFDFENYNKQLAIARPYFTESGWSDYQASIAALIQTITQNQLFVNGVVSGAPIISNQGELPGRGYVWRIQIPFMVTYQSSEQTSRQPYTVIVTIVRVPTTINPAGVGIDTFVMT